MKNLVALGDSIVSSYKLHCRFNTYGNLLARRLGLKFHDDNYSGTSTPTMLNYLRRDGEIIGHLKDAEIAVISVGGNSLYLNMLTSAMTSMGLSLNDLTMAMINDTKFSIDAKFITNMVKAFASPEMKAVIKDNVERFRIEYPIIIDAIHDINPDIIVIGQTIHNSLEESKSLFYAGINRLLAPHINAMNEIVRTLKRQNFIYTDFNRLLGEYDGEEILTYFNDGTNKFDTHLTNAGHRYFYLREYEALTAAYPKFICEEPVAILKTNDTLDEDELDIIKRDEKNLALYISMLKNQKDNPPVEYEAKTPYYDEYVKYFEITSVGANTNLHPREFWMTADESADRSNIISGYPVYFEAAEGMDITVFDIKMNRIGVIANDGGEYTARLISDINDGDYICVAYLHNTDMGILILVNKYGPRTVMRK